MLEKNKFFDINKLPTEEGLLLFPISMSRITTSQNPAHCLKYIKNFTPKFSAPKVGLNFIYGDFLYLYSPKKSSDLKEKFMFQMVNHKNGIQKLLLKERQEFQIQQAFSYMGWNQLYLSSVNFPDLLKKLREIYKNDKNFKKYIKEDTKTLKKHLDKNQINFFLEEHLAFYLMSKGQIKLPNDYIQGREKWILWCYPGKAPKALIYLYQLNPFNLHNSKNKYEDVVMYNLEDKKIYNVSNIDLKFY